WARATRRPELPRTPTLLRTLLAYSGACRGSLAARWASGWVFGSMGLDSVVVFPFVVAGPLFTRVDPPRRGKRPRCWRDCRCGPVPVVAHCTPGTGSAHAASPGGRRGHAIQGGMRSGLPCYVGLRSAGSRGLFHDHEGFYVLWAVKPFMIMNYIPTGGIEIVHSFEYFASTLGEQLRREPVRRQLLPRKHVDAPLPERGRSGEFGRACDAIVQALVLGERHVEHALGHRFGVTEAEKIVLVCLSRRALVTDRFAEDFGHDRGHVLLAQVLGAEHRHLLGPGPRAV